MRKIMIATLSLMTLLGVTGCNSSDKGGLVKKDSMNENQMIVGNGDGEIGEPLVNFNQVYGKITKVIGNEIEVSVANNPFELSEEELEELEKMEGEVGDISQSVIASESIAVEGVQGDATIFGIAMPDQEKLDLEYTGETKSFTIPTGTLILNFLTGGEGNVNDLKEGAVICISTDGEEGLEKILSLEIME